jgi:hypothetical protein
MQQAHIEVQFERQKGSQIEMMLGMGNIQYQTNDNKVLGPMIPIYIGPNKAVYSIVADNKGLVDIFLAELKNFTGVISAKYCNGKH